MKRLSHIPVRMPAILPIFPNAILRRKIKLDSIALKSLFIFQFHNAIQYICLLCRSSCSSRLFVIFLFILGSVSIYNSWKYHSNYMPPKILAGMLEYLDQLGG